MLKIIYSYNEDIMDALGKDHIVDIFSYLKVRTRLGSTFRSEQTLTVSPILSS